MTYSLTEEEMFDTVPRGLPGRTEIEILSADDPHRPAIGWNVTTYDGVKIYKLDEFGRAIEQPLQKYEDLCPGMDIAVPNFHGSYWLMKIQENLQTATANSSVAHLRFAEDERKCWVCILVDNRKR